MGTEAKFTHIDAPALIESARRLRIRALLGQEEALDLLIELHRLDERKKVTEVCGAEAKKSIETLGAAWKKSLDRVFSPVHIVAHPPER